MKHSDITDRIIASFYRVYNALGYGFLEKVYHNALLHDLAKSGLRVETKRRFDVYYDEVLVGEYFADIVVEGLVILELKSVDQFAPPHEAQLLNYLKASGLVEVGLLLNFGPKPQVRRKAFDHAAPANSEDVTDDPADELFE